MTPDQQHQDSLERALIGGLLLAADRGTLADLLAVDLADFEALDLRGGQARAVFTAMRNLLAAGAAVDPVTIEAQATKDGYGSAGYDGWFLGECAAHVPTQENVIAYAAELRERALRERLRVSLLQAAERIGRDTDTPAAELIADEISELAALDKRTEDNGRSIGEWASARWKQLEQLAQDHAAGRQALSGIPTGIDALDAKIGGWSLKVINLVAGRPAMGKSSLLMGAAVAAVRAREPVHVFTPEDSGETYADRLFSRITKVNTSAMRAGAITTAEAGALVQATAMIRSRLDKLWIVDEDGGLHVDEVILRMRRRKRTHGTRIAILDYVQLLKMEKGEKEHDALTRNLAALADSAKADGIAWVVGSQLNRELEKRPDKRPTLADLRGSGSLEEKAKVVIGLYRGHVYGAGPKRGIDFDAGPGSPQFEPTPAEFASTIQIITLKQNNGETGPDWCNWDGPTTTIW